MPGPVKMRLVFRQAIAPDVYDLRFSLVEPKRLDFKAGQFMTTAVGHDHAGILQRRSYSIASMSDAGHELRFIVKFIPDGIASDYFTGLPMGTELNMTGPYGFFVMDPQHAGDVVFAATGTGLAPVLPMLQELVHRQEQGARHVYWGLRNEADLFAVDEIKKLCDAAGAALLIHLSQPSAAWAGRRGRITPAILDKLPDLRSPTFYLVGNGAMIAELKAGLMAAGIDRKRQIRTESFFD